MNIKDRPDWKVGDLVRCVDAFGLVSLTHGAAYEVRGVGKLLTAIENDAASVLEYSHRRFEKVDPVTPTSDPAPAPFDPVRDDVAKLLKTSSGVADAVLLVYGADIVRYHGHILNENARTGITGIITRDAITRRLATPSYA